MYVLLLQVPNQLVPCPRLSLTHSTLQQGEGYFDLLSATPQQGGGLFRSRYSLTNYTLKQGEGYSGLASPFLALSGNVKVILISPFPHS
jgi:hypothetical protein